MNSNDPSGAVEVRNSPVLATAVTAIEAAGLASSRLRGETPGCGSVPMNPVFSSERCLLQVCLGKNLERHIACQRAGWRGHLDGAGGGAGWYGTINQVRRDDDELGAYAVQRHTGSA